MNKASPSGVIQNPYRFQIWKLPVYVLHVLNWIIYDGFERNYLNNLLTAVSYITHTVGTIILVLTVYGIIAAYEENPMLLNSFTIVVYVKTSSFFYLVIFTYCFIWKSWYKNQLQRFINTLYELYCPLEKGRKITVLGSLLVGMTIEIVLIIISVQNFGHMQTSMFMTYSSIESENFQVIHFLSFHDLQCILILNLLLIQFTSNMHLSKDYICTAETTRFLASNYKFWGSLYRGNVFRFNKKIFPTRETGFRIQSNILCSNHMVSNCVYK